MNQMKLAHERSADRIWIVNVGDLKAEEIPINHFLDLAYDTPKWGYNSVPEWLTLWATREFGAAYAKDIASVVGRYGLYAGRRKYELLDPGTYSVLNYNEADAVLDQWMKIGKEAQAIYDKLDEATKVAYYQLVLQPVLGGGVVTAIHINTGKNTIYGLQKRTATNTKAQEVLSLFKEDAVLTKRYHDLLNGKWKHILDQPHLGYEYWQQPMRNQVPGLTYVQELEVSVGGHIGISIEGSNATVSGDDKYHALSSMTLTLPPMDTYGPRSRWIDIYGRGPSACSWTATASQPYVKLSPSSGSAGGNNSTDTRVLVSIDWSAVSSSTIVEIKVKSGCGAWGNYPDPLIQLPVNKTSVSSSFSSGFAETNKVISIEAEHATRKTTNGAVHYETLIDHGRTLSGVTLFPVLAASQTTGSGPVLEYDIFTFSPASKANITLYLSPSLNQNGPARELKYGVAIDSQAPVEKKFAPNAVNGNFPSSWNRAVADGVWKDTTTTMHDLSQTGKHTLKVWLLEPGVTVQKIVIDLGGVVTSYLGPPESFLVGKDEVGKYDGTRAVF